MKIVLFDIDGTLIKAGGAGARALNKAVKAITGRGGEICKLFPWQGATDKANFENAFKAGAGRKPTRKEVAALQREYLARLPAEVAASIRSGKYSRIRGVGKFLSSLAGRKNVLVGLGTGNLKEGALIKLGPSGLVRHFAFGGYGCDSCRRSTVLRKAVERAGKTAGIKIKPGEVYVIGDTHKDVLAAKDAGYHSGAVLSGFGDRREIMRSNPELMIKDYSDLKPWLMWLGLERDPKGVSRGTYLCPDSPIEHAQYGRTGMNMADLENAVGRLRSVKRKTGKA